ncbi:hypothetical protein GTO87_02875 [Ligilactobacillus saerimneri]|uniref:Uncharacterized protein n=1 Tax=Ligilactobacillus saerimneri TaxID=228229 RepID=A0A7H9EJ17_9LACO|nr:hypothetical protein [Ligilactobacillus saerimneri]QLL77634.1 hypothetical protein GTO87_02875 [Ligilactobacillus saerimneri]
MISKQKLEKWVAELKTLAEWGEAQLQVMKEEEKTLWLVPMGYEDNDHTLRRYWAKTDHDDVFLSVFFIEGVEKLTYEYCQKENMLLTSEEVERLKAIQGEPYATLIDQVKVKFDEVANEE